MKGAKIDHAVTIEGLGKLNKQIERLAKTFEPDGVEPILYSGAEIITAQVQQNVNRINKVSGRLSRSPVTRKLDRRQHNQPAGSIAAIDRSIAPHAHLVERGGRGGQMPAQPYFRPAVESTRDQVVRHVYNELKSKLEGLTR